MSNYWNASDYAWEIVEETSVYDDESLTPILEELICVKLILVMVRLDLTDFKSDD